MYTTKNFNDDLYQICKTHYVKFKLLKDFASNHISQKDFIEVLEDEMAKSQTEIAEILVKLGAIQLKIQQNGGRLDEDPILQVTQLRKENRLQEAFNIIVPIVQGDPNNEEAAIAFGWVMYDYLKQSENNIQTYVNNLMILNDNVSYQFKNNVYLSDDSMTILKNSILWSLRRVVRQHDHHADAILPELLRFCSNNAAFIEQRFFGRDASSASRLLIKDIRGSLNDTNYSLFMDAIGFNWFDAGDYAPSSFVNDKKETVQMRPLAEVILNFHAKKLIAMPSSNEIEQKINDFVVILDAEILKNPTFEWLSYYKAKLLMKVNRNDEALETVVNFARTKSKEFWVWDLISELADGEQKFNCLCAAVLCKTKQEMLVGIQEKIISHLVERELLANAKYELDQLIATRMQKWGKISQQIANLKNESWYVQTTAADNREQLKPYAEKAETILYETLPYRDIFVTYVNNEKGIINFAYLVNQQIKKGYFYMDAIEQQDWQAEQTLKVKMLEDKKREELYKIYAVAPGDEAYLQHFIQSDTGYVEKNDSKAFAFVDDVYISPNLVKEHNLEHYDEIDYIKKRTFNKRRNTWGWAVVKITAIEKDSSFDFE